MDKRSLIFIFSVTVSLFFIKLFFGYWEADQNRQWYEQQRAIRLKQTEAMRVDISARTAAIDQLPIANVYRDEAKTQWVADGVWIDGVLLVVAGETKLPQALYVVKSSSKPVRVTQLASDQHGGPSIYGQSDQRKLQLGTLRDLGKYDLQLLSSWKDEQGTHSTVTLGEYVDGQFLIRGDLPRGPALALIKDGDSYLPVGYVQAENFEFHPLDHLAGLANAIALPKAAPIATTKASTGQEQKFYVLENPYFQLVFSNRGGAITEINLPFETEADPHSVVRSISFDKEMVEQEPWNAHFPAHSYYTPAANGGQPVEHEEGKLGGYYPLLRRDLIGQGGKMLNQVKPEYYALNIVSEYPEVAQLNYEVKSFTDSKIVFEAVQPHRRITKTFSIQTGTEGAPYVLNLEVKVDGDSRGLWLTTGIPDVELMSGASTPALKYRITRQQKTEVESLSLPKDNEVVSSIYPDWICNSNGFLGLILDPLTEMDPGYMVQHVSGISLPTRLVELGRQYDRFKAADYPGYNMMLPLKRQGGVMQFRIFAGPFSEGILKAVDTTFSDAATGYNPDYIAAQSFHGWFAFISEPFAKFLLILMRFFYYLTNSWAGAIVLLTVALRIMLYPLNGWSLRSMRRMQTIAPEIAKIQEKNKKDPKKAQLEIMNLYKERGINPMSGCFPILIQIPFLIGMFDLLKSTFELRGAPFIPGWIDNLTAPDVLFRWETPYFLIGNEFHLLPIILGAVMYLQSRMSATGPTDVKMMTDQQRQQRAMSSLMPVMFTVMFYNFASGLNIYWLSSMLLSMGQQWIVNRQESKAATARAAGKGKVEILPAKDKAEGRKAKG